MPTGSLFYRTDIDIVLTVKYLIRTCITYDHFPFRGTRYYRELKSITDVLGIPDVTQYTAVTGLPSAYTRIFSVFPPMTFNLVPHPYTVRDFKGGNLL